MYSNWHPNVVKSELLKEFCNTTTDIRPMTMLSFPTLMFMTSVMLCLSHISLMQAKFQIIIRTEGRKESAGIPQYLNVHKTNLLWRKTCSIIYTTSMLLQLWREFCNRVFPCMVEIMGYARSNHGDWFDEMDTVVQTLLSAKQRPTVITVTSAIVLYMLQAQDSHKPILSTRETSL